MKRKTDGSKLTDAFYKDLKGEPMAPLPANAGAPVPAGRDDNKAEILAILQALQKKFVPHSEMHNQLAKAIKLANP